MINELTAKTKKENLSFRYFFRSCPVRHVCLLLAAIVIGLYFLFRENRTLMTDLTDRFVHPFHQFMGRVCSAVPFSVGEIACLLLLLGMVVYLIRAIVLLITHVEKLRRLYLTFLTLVSTGLCVYAGFCLFWGVYYYSNGFEAQSGMESAALSVEELKTVTDWFAALANEYSGSVPRDEDGLYFESVEEIFDRASTLYRNASAHFPCLDGPELRPKPLLVSEVMSYINFTGFFFPFTGEANLNVASPRCLLPSTFAHELAHQRGVSAEQEANFVAVLACLESNDASFAYSGALLAYIHLGNALYAADYDAWLQAYSLLNEAVQADLRANNEYWARYETKAAEVSENLYEGFLQSHGQKLGMKSYGACIDLLVAYYYDYAWGAAS